MRSDKWLNCRLRDLQVRLAEKAHTVSLPVISRLLHQRDYNLRANVKDHEGHSPTARDEQFLYLQAQRRPFQEAQQSVLSIDTKKKERVGDFKNSGTAFPQPGTQPH